MAIGSTPGGSGHVVPDDPDHPLVVPEDTVAMARMEDARFREQIAQERASAGESTPSPPSPRRFRSRLTQE